MGNILSVYVHAANIHDTKGGVFTFEKALFYYPSIEGVCTGSAYKKHFRNIFEEFHNLKVDISERLTSTFQVIPKCWRIERTFSWLCHSRRLSKEKSKRFTLKLWLLFLIFILFYADFNPMWTGSKYYHFQKHGFYHK